MLSLVCLWTFQRFYLDLKSMINIYNNIDNFKFPCFIFLSSNYYYHATMFRFPVMNQLTTFTEMWMTSSKNHSYTYQTTFMFIFLFLIWSLYTSNAMHHAWEKPLDSHHWDDFLHRNGFLTKAKAWKCAELRLAWEFELRGHLQTMAPLLQDTSGKQVGSRWEA